MKEDLPQDELWTLMEQCEHVQDLIVHRKDRVKRQQQIRRENKAAARLKRMAAPCAVRPSRRSSELVAVWSARIRSVAGPDDDMQGLSVNRVIYTIRGFRGRG